MAAFMPFSVVRAADDLGARLDQLAAEVAHQAEIIQAQQKTIESLKEEVARQKPQPKEASAPEAKVSGFFGASALTNPNISLVLDTFAYASNLNNDALEGRGIPGFTTSGLEQRKGFNLREAELFLFSPVDPYFNLYVNLPVSDDGHRTRRGLCRDHRASLTGFR